VDDENDLGRRVVDIGHDLMDEGAYNALLEASIRCRRIPDRFEVAARTPSEAGSAMSSGVAASCMAVLPSTSPA